MTGAREVSPDNISTYINSINGESNTTCASTTQISFFLSCHQNFCPDTHVAGRERSLACAGITLGLAECRNLPPCVMLALCFLSHLCWRVRVCLCACRPVGLSACLFAGVSVCLSVCVIHAAR